MSFGSVYEQQPSTKTADYTILSTDDLVIFNPTTTALTATLYTPVANWRSEVRVVNSGTNILNVAAAAGSILGPATLYPGQQALFQSDGVGLWVCPAPPATSGQLQTALSAAQINAIRTTPVAIVPAPGAGKIVVVDHVTLKMVRTSTQFANGGAVELRYTDGSGAKVSADIAATVVTGAAGTAYSSVRGVATELVPVANAAIVVTCATANFDTGTGVGQVTVKYRVVTP